MSEQFWPTDSATKRARAEAELRQLEERREALLTFLRVDRELERQDSASAASAQVGRAFGPADPVPDPQDDVPIPADVDLEGADNLIERLLRIAKATGGTLHVKQVADYLMSRGVYGGKVENLISHIYGDLKQHPDFVKVGKGAFDYRPGQQAEELNHEGPPMTSI